MTTTSALPETLPATSPATTWPIAGAPGFAQVDPAWRASTLEWMEGTLARHVVAPWFPRSVDRQRGGFHSEFGHRWRRLPEMARLLEHQARQTRSLARLAEALPMQDWMANQSLVALRYVRETYWDSTNGGLFELVGMDGSPLMGGTKHAHGSAYAITAGAEAYRATGAWEALEFALDVFSWLDAHLHDKEYGGYHGWAAREGRPILTPADVPPELPQRRRDHLGHDIGLKDANVHSDLLEALVTLVEVGGGDTVRQRLDELYEIVTTRFTTPMGAVHYLTDPALRPVPGPEQFGFPSQVGSRIVRAAAATGRPVGVALKQARQIADHVLDRALDGKSHGFFEAGPSPDSASLSGRDLIVRTHPWWVQTEAAQLLLNVALEWPAEGRYQSAVEGLLEFLERELLDDRNGGFLRRPRREWPLRHRFPPSEKKADQWKDSSHEVDMCLRSIRMLRGVVYDAPIKEELPSR